MEKKYVPHRTVRPLHELLESGTLVGLAVIPFLGWIEAEFSLGQDSSATPPLLVPILVSTDPHVAEQPIIGFNVIKAVLSQKRGHKSERDTVCEVSTSFSVQFKTAKLVITLIQSTDSGNEAGIVQTGRRQIHLSANQVMTAWVKVNTGSQFKGQSLLLVPSKETSLPEGVTIEEGLVTVPADRLAVVPVPIANTNNYAVTLDRRIVLGHLQVIKSALPMATGQINRDNSIDSKDQHSVDNSKRKETVSKSNSERQKPSHWEPQAPFDHLSGTQKEIVRQLLREECHAFTFDEEDISCILSLNLHITLHDTTPVKKTYESVPKPLHQEVKEYLQDLLNR